MEKNKHNSKAIYWIIVSFIFLLSFGLAKAQCPNLNFSYGNLTHWQCYIGGCSSGNYHRTPSQPIPGRHTVLEITSLTLANNLWDENCNVIKKIPDGCTYSLLLGNTGTGSETEAVSYRMTVDSNNSLLILSFAFVLQSPSGHEDNVMPVFQMTLYDTNWNILNVPCGNNNFISSPGLPALACNTGTIVARDWTTIGFSLESLIGQTIIIFFETRDCGLGAHFGYAYMTAQCRPMTIDLTYCEGSNAARLRAPDGFISYLWHRSSQPNWYATTQQINIQNPLDGEEFSCTLVSALGCSSTIKTVIAKTSIDASFVYGVKENGVVDITDPDHLDQYGLFKNYYDTCTRTATFVDMSFVVNSKKDNVVWSAPCRTKVNGRNDTTGSFINFASHDSLYTFTFPDPGEEGNDPIDYLIRLLVEAENGCGKESDSTAEHWIRIYPAPKIEIIGDENMCEGNEAVLTANTLRSFFVDYHWIYKRDSNNRATTFEADGPSLTIHGPGLYILEALDSVGCYAYDTLEVKPLEPIMEITKTDVKCHGEHTGSFKPGKITGILAIMDAYWVLKDIGGNDSIVDVTSWAMNGSIMPFSNLAAGTYTFYATDPTGCELRKEVVITEPDLLEDTMYSEPTTCNLENGKASVVPRGGTPPYSYVWKKINTQGSTNTTDNIKNAGSGWHYVTITDANGCIKEDSVFVDALPFPVINIDSVKIETCEKSDGYIAVHVDYASQPVDYKWTPGNYTDSVVNYIKSGTYNVIITDANGCQADTTVIVGSYPALYIDGTVHPETCGRGDGSIITNIISGDPNSVLRMWAGSPTDVSNEHGDTVNGLSAGTYTITVYDTFCMAYKTFAIEHIDGPDANFEAVSYSVASNSIFTLTDESKGTCTYWSWDMGDGNNQDGKIIYYTYENAGDYVVFLEVIDENGCIDTISKIIHVYDELNVFIPNTFTPNKDGLNDTWAPVINETSENGYQLSIFDRWGNKIFYSTDPAYRWDGTVDGKFVENNTVYTYKLTVRDYMGQEYEYVGHVLVLR